MMRVISGGVDYVGGVERGVSFGLQEVLGVEVDIDLAGKDALQHKLAYLEDAREDFETIRQPITWYHGKYDAWMDLDRIKNVLVSDTATNRRLVLLPTGHQLRSSREALDVFQEIASEIASMAHGSRIAPALPDLGELAQRQKAERSRLARPSVNLRSFWRDYLVGRDGTLGIELMTAASAYRSLMAAQVDALALSPGAHTADLGSGVGSFSLHVSEIFAGREPVVVFACDFVRAGLLRGRARLEGDLGSDGARVHGIECDLDRGPAVPLRTGSMDAVMASLLLSYLRNPEAMLREIRRILRPGGRLVASSLRRDADISKIFMDGLQELTSIEGVEHLGAAQALVDEAAPKFLNDAARLLDLEEFGFFNFWEIDELVALVEGAGFAVVSAEPGFGEPPQAIVVTATSR